MAGLGDRGVRPEAGYSCVSVAARRETRGSGGLSVGTVRPQEAG